MANYCRAGIKSLRGTLGSPFKRLIFFMRHFFSRVKTLPESIKVDVFEEPGRMPSCTGVAWPTEYIFLLQMKQGQCICPLIWSVHCNFIGDGKSIERGWACTPPTSPAWANFTLTMECTPESDCCYSVYSVAWPTQYTCRPLVRKSRK